MDKKFTVCVPFYVDDNLDATKLEIVCCINHVNDLLRAFKQISLNEVVFAFWSVCTQEHRYSYRWGYDLKKDDHIGVQVIKNPANPKVWYLKFTARDIVEDR